MTLRNKLDITDEIELAHEEERVSKLGALALYRDGTLDTLVPGTFSALKAIHVALFDNIYDLAGRVRTVNLAKGNFRFVSALYLESAIRSIEAMPQGNFDQIVEKYVEMNIAHPFREGNGRSIRELIRCMGLKYGLRLNWGNTDRDTLIDAAIASVDDDMAFCDVLTQCLETEE